MITGISDETVKDLREQVYEILDKFGDLSYDYHHVRRVEALCAWLAIKRGLDLNIAETIGLLHDMGRIYSNVTGKQHSMAGAKLAKQWLLEYPIPDEVIEVVCHAIACHNSKKKIGNSYAELIKDADSLAHEIEFGDMLNAHENLRASCAKLNPLEYKLATWSVIVKTYTRKIKELQQDLKLKGLKGRDVHRIRVNIRSIRIFLSLIREIDDSKEYKRLNKSLRSRFKLFERSRKLTVFKESLKEAGVEKKYLKSIKEEIKLENKTALKELADSSKDIKKVFKNIDFKEIDEHALVSVFNKRIHQYKDCLAGVEVKSMENIHDLRIQGKMFKYLIDDGIVIMNDKEEMQRELDYRLIANLHICIGNLHDIEENEALLNEYFGDEAELPEACIMKVKQEFSANKKMERKRLKLLVFHMRKRLG